MEHMYAIIESANWDRVRLVRDNEGCLFVGSSRLRHHVQEMTKTEVLLGLHSIRRKIDHPGGRVYIACLGSRDRGVLVERVR